MGAGERAKAQIELCATRTAVQGAAARSLTSGTLGQAVVEAARAVHHGLCRVAHCLVGLVHHACARGGAAGAAAAIQSWALGMQAGPAVASSASSQTAIQTARQPDSQTGRQEPARQPGSQRTWLLGLGGALCSACGGGPQLLERVLQALPGGLVAAAGGGLGPAGCGAVAGQHGGAAARRVEWAAAGALCSVSLPAAVGCPWLPPTRGASSSAPAAYLSATSRTAWAALSAVPGARPSAALALALAEPAASCPRPSASLRTHTDVLWGSGGAGRAQ
jgi:hypothetical protein